MANVDIGLLLTKEGYARDSQYVSAENYVGNKRLGLWKSAGVVFFLGIDRDK